MSKRVSFIAVTGQRDNVGDSLLRRPLVRAVPSASGRAIFVGSDSEDYIGNLRLNDSDIIFTSRSAWMGAMVKEIFCGRGANIILNAGELTVGLAAVRDRLLMAPIVILAKIRGGAFIHAGSGLRNPNHSLTAPLRWFLRMATLVTWRDERSCRAVGLGAVEPDWAFGEGPDIRVIDERHKLNRESAPRIALSIRGDGAGVSAERAASLAETVGRLGAVAVVVVQVRRDTDAARSLARQLGAPLVEWPEADSHDVQERRLREAYAGCTWVASDRLHVVASAATEGAVPLALVPDSHGKVSRTLAPAKLSLKDPVGAVDSLPADQQELLRGLEHARSRLRVVTDTIALECGQKSARPVDDTSVDC